MALYDWKIGDVWGNTDMHDYTGAHDRLTCQHTVIFKLARKKIRNHQISFLKHELNLEHDDLSFE